MFSFSFVGRRSEMLLLFISVAFGMVSADSWGYDPLGKFGPNNWAHVKLTGDNYCGASKQSPIDIDTTLARWDKLMNPLKLTHHDKIHPVIVVNNGHSIQLNADNWLQRLSGGPLSGEYKLIQMHFHWGNDSYRGSEHTINGKRYPIELHMVHMHQNVTDGKPNFSGALAVLGIMFDLTNGDSNIGVNKIARVISGLETGQSTNLSSDLSPSMLLPSIKEFFTYEGSLTTPPCSEVVTWLNLKEPLKINENDLNAFRSTKCPDNSTMGDNFRPLMPLGNRMIRASFGVDSCNSLASSLMVILTSLGFSCLRR